MVSSENRENSRHCLFELERACKQFSSFEKCNQLTRLGLLWRSLWRSSLGVQFFSPSSCPLAPDTTIIWLGKFKLNDYSFVAGR